MSNSITVAVRCRPLNTREKTRGAVGLIRMEGNQTIITKPLDSKVKPDPNAKPDPHATKTFAFDYSYWSADKDAPNYTSQQDVFNDLGQQLLDHAFAGYNTCIFACKSDLQVPLMYINHCPGSGYGQA
ncbi:hypothetical protein IWQ60_010212 [Tieghemiomyces parasiticus]|uniref:Kinesin motor domain-containing protein n=1 Tax=Tieghemiomyces parasiticus TaxID=78921 RepID=A0A9W7ZKG4_9FUNG|nr:hypothetical protein IWQ60_010212 [Tieghemiomyces parasiticus]